MSEQRSRVAVVLGTRPEMVKLARIVSLLGDRALVVHTGQHYSSTLATDIARDVSFPVADHNFTTGGLDRGVQIGEATSHLARLFAKDRPAAVIVQGDTNSALAGALAANACEVPLLHVEAGLRSFDRRMPEEHNRILIDHLADLCCAPTSVNVENLLREGIPQCRVNRTGNSVVEAVQVLSPLAPERRATVFRIVGSYRPFVLVTLHRPENVDDPRRLGAIIQALGGIEVKVLFPVHPRTSAGLRDIAIPGNVHLTGGLGYRDFLALLAGSEAVLTDSGGVQEEISVLKRFAVVLRRSTERPEVLGSFAELTDDPSKAVSMINSAMASKRVDALRDIPCPYGDGTASDQVVAALDEITTER